MSPSRLLFLLALKATADRRASGTTPRAIRVTQVAAIGIIWINHAIELTADARANAVPTPVSLAATVVISWIALAGVYGRQEEASHTIGDPLDGAKAKARRAIRGAASRFRAPRTQGTPSEFALSRLPSDERLKHALVNDAILIASQDVISAEFLRGNDVTGKIGECRHAHSEALYEIDLVSIVELGEKTLRPRPCN